MNFNHITPVYDYLADLVFRKKIKNITQQGWRLCRGNTLIIGGGTGRFLNDYHPVINQVTYVETSTRMMAYAQKNADSFSAPIHFRSSINSFDKFDCIFLPFVLDCWSDDEITVFLKKSNGIPLIICDFRPPKSHYEKLLSFSMIYFFRLVSGYPRRSIPDITALLTKHRKTVAEVLDNGFISLWECSV